jgi:hypothetical protein
VLAQALGRLLGQQFVVENRSGAAAPDLPTISEAGLTGFDTSGCRRRPAPRARSSMASRQPPTRPRNLPTSSPRWHGRASTWPAAARRNLPSSSAMTWPNGSASPARPGSSANGGAGADHRRTAFAASVALRRCKPISPCDPTVSGPFGRRKACIVLAPLIWGIGRGGNSHPHSDQFRLPHMTRLPPCGRLNVR